MIKKTGYVYILANGKNGTLYIGVTSDLIKRINEHKNNAVDGFTKKYSVHTLVYYEVFEDIVSAIEREKQIKNWQRKWKIELIEKENIEWKDLFEDLLEK
jgi:putative endonuclease